MRASCFSSIALPVKIHHRLRQSLFFIGVKLLFQNVGKRLYIVPGVFPAPESTVVSGQRLSFVDERDTGDRSGKVFDLSASVGRHKAFSAHSSAVHARVTPF